MKQKIIPRFTTSLRRLIKASLAYTAYYSGILDPLVAYRTGIKNPHRIVILGYHRVVKDYNASSRLAIPSLLISVQTLRRHLELIQKNFYCISLDEALAVIAGRCSLARDAVVLTFDDGYQDFYDNAFPLLQEFGMPAALFIPTALIGTTAPLLHDQIYYLIMLAEQRGTSITKLLERFGKTLLERYGLVRPLMILRRSLENNRADYYGAMRALYEIPRPNLEMLLHEIKQELKLFDDDFPVEYRLLSWPMVSEMAAKGITIGAHTCNHALLTEELMAISEQEIHGSKIAIEKHLGMPARHFAYPDGRYNLQIANMVRKAGFESACTVEDRPNTLLDNPYQLKRKILWEHACSGMFREFSNIVAECQLRGLFANPLYKLLAPEVNNYE